MPSKVQMEFPLALRELAAVGFSDPVDNLCNTTSGKSEPSMW